MWRNWQTRRFQVPVGDHMGSSPFIRTKNRQVSTCRFFIHCEAMVYHHRAECGVYHQPRAVSRLRNDDIQFLAELVIYKDFVFDDIHACGVIEMREFKSSQQNGKNIFFIVLSHVKILRFCRRQSFKNPSIFIFYPFILKELGKFFLWKLFGT